MAQTAMTVRLDSVQKAKFDQLCGKRSVKAVLQTHTFILYSVI